LRLNDGGMDYGVRIRHQGLGVRNFESCPEHSRRTYQTTVYANSFKPDISGGLLGILLININL